MGKGKYGGKYERITNATGYFGRNTVGNPQFMGEHGAGTKRKFVGSDVREFTFYSKTRGTLTIRATSYDEAWKLAKARGYSRKHKR